MWSSSSTIRSSLASWLAWSLSRSPAALGKIGLLAVAEQARGRGVGRRLVRQANEWMTLHGAHEARVVTQLANEPACGLYRACGYTLAAVEDYYHFWPPALAKAS